MTDQQINSAVAVLAIIDLRTVSFDESGDVYCRCRAGLPLEYAAGSVIAHALEVILGAV